MRQKINPNGEPPQDAFLIGIDPAGEQQKTAGHERVVRFRFTNKTDVGGLWGSQWIMANYRWVTIMYNKTTPPSLPQTGY